MRSRTLIATLLFMAVSICTQAQDLRVELEPLILKNFNGLQSYAWAQVGSKVLLLGGRTDGLHLKQPFASFSSKYNNTDIFVIDLKTETVWKKQLSGLSTGLTEQLQSSNMQFWQDGDQLVLVGGYGYSASRDEHISFPALSVIRIKECMEAIQSNGPLQPHITQIKDERMAVTGGHLAKLGDYYLLVGGQRFDGRYNPHGPDHGPGYSQQYTNEIRKFRLDLSKNSPELTDYTAIHDTALFHRRDYNLLPQYNEKGEKIFTIFSGVFRPDADLPYHTLVDVGTNGGKLIKGFEQQYCHYHAAALPLYDVASKTQYTVFFGGISQFYIDSAGEKQKDNDVPFTKTISLIKRKGGTTTEQVLTDMMPGYFGASADFIPKSESLLDEHKNLPWESLKVEKMLAGYIIGGIDSRAPNIFWDGGPESSRASPVIWKVYLSVAK